MKDISTKIAQILLVLLIVMVGIILYRQGVVQVPATHPAPITATSTPLPEHLVATSANPIHPTQLRIPKIDVVAAVEPVGVDEQGNMAVPSDWRDVSWYEPGFAPGEVGNAVFSGHLDWDGNTAVFWELDNLEPGDVVHIQGNGRQLTYMVTGIEVYDYQLTDTSPVFGPADYSQIKLITCDGEFIDGSDTYEKRLIVTAQLVK